MALAVAAVVAATAASQALRPQGPLNRVIVRATQSAVGDLDSAISAVGGRVLSHIGIVDAAVAEVPASGLAALRAAQGIVEVTPDLPVQLDSLPSGYDPTTDVASAYSTTLLTGAQSYWSAGYTGAGIDVALIDSGTVPVDGLLNGRVVNGPDLSFESTVPQYRNLDTFGHGTHMASLIAGHDSEAVTPYSANTSAYVGMAPDARVVSIKVADYHGIADVSQVLAGIDWAVEHAHDPGMNIRVMNLSFGTNATQSYVLDPLSFAAETAWHHGIVVVASTGNAGWKAGVNNPAENPYLIAVGAANTNGTMTTADDSVAAFSSGGDSTRNPDLVAPGVHLQGLRDPGSAIDSLNPQAVLAGRFFRGSGTSQATAIVSGAVALILQQHPNATPDQVKALLRGTATPLANTSAVYQGTGELNLGSAVTAVLQPALFTTQLFVPSTGLGTIEGSRGSVHVSFSNGVTLTGEVDAHLSPIAAGPLAYLESILGAWTGATFNGAIWDGNTQPPTGSEYAGSNWSGSNWSGSNWSGSNWSGSNWSGSNWSGSNWSGSNWSGSNWSGSNWSNAEWD
ncbi:MAG TPA: S8 family serine peptidase [Candidatus Dormibacteraeota bacterium]|nr:S8 family serine peptidase [Candidatus Dormibacteraeota bacterium]